MRGVESAGAGRDDEIRLGYVSVLSGCSWVSMGADEFLGGDVVEFCSWASFRSDIDVRVHFDSTTTTRPDGRTGVMRPQKRRPSPPPKMSRTSLV